MTVCALEACAPTRVDPTLPASPALPAAPAPAPAAGDLASAPKTASLQPKAAAPLAAAFAGAAVAPRGKVEKRDNWSGFVELRGRFFEPTTVEELRAIVAGSPQVRLLGKRHSFTDLLQAEKGKAAVPPVYVDMTRFNRILEVQPPRPGAQYGTVTVQGGATIRELNAALDQAGYALRTAPTIDEVTVAGAIATGSHGTRLHDDPARDQIPGDEGPLSDEIIAMELMDAEGNVRRLVDPADLAVLKLPAVPGANPADIQAARLHLGALGVVLSVTFKTVPAFNLSLEQKIHAESDFFVPGKLDALIAGNRGSDWFWFIDGKRDPQKSKQKGKVVARRQNLSPASQKTYADAPERRRALARERDAHPTPGALNSFVRGTLFGTWGANGLLRLGSALPPDKRNGFNGALAKTATAAFPETSFVDKSYRVTHYFPAHARVTTMEYSLPLDRVHALPELVRRVQQQTNTVSPLGVYMRLQGKSDKTPMSLSGGRDSIILEFYWPSAYGRPDAYYAALERELAALGGSGTQAARAHLAKEVGVPQAAAYPPEVVANFRRMANEMDPHGKLGGGWLRRMGFGE